MDASPDADKTLAAKYEAAFCAFMAVAAYLWRDNADLVYPHVLYLFSLLLGLNLVGGIMLRAWPLRGWISALFIVGNCGAITAILKYSGGTQSNLWILYLLPIYTVCLLLGPREVFWITSGAIAFNAAALIGEIPHWSATEAFSLALKSAVFILAASLTWKIVARDRTARARLQAERNQVMRLQDMTRAQGARLEETQALAEVGLISSGIAHDLNNTFTVILGFADLTLQQPELAPQIKEDMEHIRNSARLGRGIAATVLRLGKREKAPLSPCDLRESIRSVAEILHGVLAKNGVELCWERHEYFPLVLGDPTLLQRLFLNLMTNAVKAMKDGGRLSVEEEVLPGRMGRPAQLRILIEDTGPGIPDRILAHLFKPFSTTRGGESGTGLGLYICSEIAKQHGGRLHAENRATGGARISLYLPAVAQGRPVMVVGVPADL